MGLQATSLRFAHWRSITLGFRSYIFKQFFQPLAGKHSAPDGTVVLDTPIQPFSRALASQRRASRSFFLSSYCSTIRVKHFAPSEQLSTCFWPSFVDLISPRQLRSIAHLSRSLLTIGRSFGPSALSMALRFSLSSLALLSFLFRGDNGAYHHPVSIILRLGWATTFYCGRCRSALQVILISRELVKASDLGPTASSKISSFQNWALLAAVKALNNS